jgi:hypothetical protein
LQHGHAGYAMLIGVGFDDPLSISLNNRHSPREPRCIMRHYAAYVTWQSILSLHVQKMRMQNVAVMGVHCMRQCTWDTLTQHVYYSIMGPM